MLRWILPVLLLVALTSCSTVQTAQEPAVAQPEPAAEAVAEKPPVEKEEPGLAKYSENNNFAPATDRDYRRMTRQQMEDESELQAGAGSLWVMEGQTSYLFAQNKQKRIGDPFQLKVEGSALKQIEMKVAAIKDLLKELEIQKKEQEEKEKAEAAEKQRLADIEQMTKDILANGEARTESSAKAMAQERVNARKPAAVEPAKDDKKTAAAKEEKIDLKEVENIPAKVVEKMPDGMLRVTGQQFLTIQKRPYKVIATGLVRPEDFDEVATSTAKMFEPQFDVIHVKKNTTSTVK